MFSSMWAIEPVPGREKDKLGPSSLEAWGMGHVTRRGVSRERGRGPQEVTVLSVAEMSK